MTYDWYGGTPPHQKHSDTSKAAAQSIEAIADIQRKRVFDYIRSCGKHGATDEEIQVHLAMEGNTERPRRVELVDKLHLVEDSGMRRLTTKKRKSTVWVVVENVPENPPMKLPKQEKVLTKKQLEKENADLKKEIKALTALIRKLKKRP